MRLEKQFAKTGEKIGKEAGPAIGRWIGSILGRATEQLIARWTEQPLPANQSDALITGYASADPPTTATQ